MFRELLIATIALQASVFAGHSPHGAEFFAKYGSERYSSDIIEDASLDVIGLLTKYGYPAEAHRVTTSDGYVLELHRIAHGRDRNNRPGPRKAVLLQHGLLSSSADYIIMGPGKGLGYILAEEGYDVWMGNGRGNHYSRRHLSLNPDSILRSDFWDFSWCEIGRIDLPAMIDYILEKTGESKIHYIGHSQGTTAFYVMASSKPEYNDKIISMHALAPVAFMTNMESPLLRLAAAFLGPLDSLMSILGINEFMPNSQVMSWAGQALCNDNSAFQPVCTNILFLIAGFNVDQMNATALPMILAHTPAGASTQQLIHYGQGIQSGHFRWYDLGWLRNIARYGSRYPPDYDLSRVTAPVALHYSDNDWLAHVDDVDRLFVNLPNVIGKFRVPLDKFNHLDFLWAIDVYDLLYKRVIAIMKAMEQ